MSRSAEQYRDLAQLYLDIARSLPHGEHRTLLVDAAQTYLQLAEEQGAAISPPSKLSQPFSSNSKHNPIGRSRKNRSSVIVEAAPPHR